MSFNFPCQIAWCNEITLPGANMFAFLRKKALLLAILFSAVAIENSISRQDLDFFIFVEQIRLNQKNVSNLASVLSAIYHVDKWQPRTLSVTYLKLVHSY